MDDTQNTAAAPLLTPDNATVPGIVAAFENVNARLAALEARPVAARADDFGNSETFARVLKHIYDWAQHFGMKPLPSTVEKPKPVVIPPPIQPEGFDPFRRA